MMHLALCVLAFSLAGCATAPSGHQAILTEEFMVAAVDPGVELYVRNKRLASMSEFPAERVVLFVHGSTYPAETATFR